MNHQDFVKLRSLLSKLDMATQKAVTTDGCFRKYHRNSLSLLKDLPVHLQQIEQGLMTAKIIPDLNDNYTSTGV